MAALQNLSRIVTGPAEVRVGGVTVGRTSGPVRARFTPLLREETSAHTGASPVDYVVVGAKAELFLTLAEYILENVLLAMPYGGYAYGHAQGYARIGPLPGARLSGGAAPVTVHPLACEPNDASEDVTLHSAVCVGVTELEYSSEGDRLVEARLVGLVDFSRTDGDMIARVAAPARS